MVAGVGLLKLNVGVGWCGSLVWLAGVGCWCRFVGVGQWCGLFVWVLV